MMQTLRKKTRLVLFIVLAAFAMLIFFEWGLDITGISPEQETAIVKVDNFTVSYPEYLRYVQAKESEKKGISREEIWSELIDEIMWNNLIRKERIRVTDEEIWAIIRNNPPPQIYNSEHMKNEQGEFDYNKYLELLRSPQSRPWLAEYEYNLRRELPKEKLRSLISTMGWVSAFEDSIILAKQTAVYDFSFISLAKFKLRGKVSITDEKLREYYNKNIKEFTTPESRILKYVFFERAASSADTQEARERLDDFIARLKEGEDFLALAQQVSDDSIVEKSFTKAEELPGHQLNVYKNLKDGQVSDLIQGPGGFELVKRVRDGLIYQVKANIKISPSTLGEIHDRIEAFKESAKEQDFETAAQEMNMPVRSTYPLTTQRMTFPIRNPEELVKFLSKKANYREIVGPLSSIAGYYLFVLDSVIPEKVLNFEENQLMIRAKFEKERLKHELIGYIDNLHNQLVAGKTMPEIASADSLITFQPGIKDMNLQQIQSSYGPDFAGVVASLEPGQLSAPLITEWAGYLIRCDKKVVMPFDSAMVTMLQFKRQMRLQELSQQLFTAQKVVDNRDKFFE